MHERVEAEGAEAPAPTAASGFREGPVVQRMLALQRSAGNHAVTRMLARQTPGDSMFRPTEFVFILGAKDDDALATAKAHYRSALMSSPSRKVIVREDMSDPSLAGIFTYLSAIKYPIAEITIVVHGDAQGDLYLPLNTADTSPKSTTPDELDQAIHDGVLTPLRDGQITQSTRIRLQACFSGYGPRMVNLLDRAFGDGAGTVIAPKVEVAYAKDVWHSEGLSGWWISSPDRLNRKELAVALKTKYGAALKGLDLTTYQSDVGTHHKGESMPDDDAMWEELARQAKEDSSVVADGTTWWVYVANAFVQSVKPGYEAESVLYTKSDYRYTPTEL